MPRAWLDRAARIHGRLAIPVFVIPTLVYLVAWRVDPHLYGFSVLGLAGVQLAWPVAGLAFLALRVPVGRRPLVLVMSGAAAGSALIAFAFLKSINWA